MEVVDDLGERVDLHRGGSGDLPMRIVSLVPSLTETVAAWGIEPIGVTDWCTTPPLPAATRVRGTKNPDIDVIVGLGPDLVLADQEENRRVDVERLRAAGVPVYVTAPRSLPDVARTVERLAAVLGAGAEGNALAATIRGAISNPPPAALRTFCPIWRDPWMAVGTGTVAGDLLAHAGFDVVPRLPRYPRVALEDVLSLRPEVVLLPSEPYEFGVDDTRDFDGWGADVRLIDGQSLTWWGARTPHALAELRALASAIAANRRGRQPGR